MKFLYKLGDHKIAVKFLPFFHFVLERAALPPFWFRFVT